MDTINSEALPAETPNFDTLFKNFWSGSTYKNIGRLSLSDFSPKERDKIEEEILNIQSVFDKSIVFFKVVRPGNKPILQLYIQKQL